MEKLLKKQPGIKECYEKRLITYSDPSQIGGTGWTFDLNALAVMHKYK